MQHTILLYSDQEQQALNRARESRIQGAIFQVIILGVLALMVIRFIVKLIFRKPRKQ